jgi:hypothetical protein
LPPYGNPQHHTAPTPAAAQRPCTPTP